MANVRKTASIAAICSALIMVPTLAVSQDAGEKAMENRQGLMRLIVWEAGPLFGMASGDMAYDAAAAEAHAANLAALSQYPYPRLFLPGTSDADHPGKSCALPEIWSETAKFSQTYEEFGATIADLGEVAGDGQEALAAAVGEMGKACGSCHKGFRAKDESKPWGLCVSER
jgi:cytochrome c556